MIVSLCFKRFGKKTIHSSSNHSDVRTLRLKVPKIHSELSSRTHSVTFIGVGALNDRNHQGSSQKFSQLVFFFYFYNVIWIWFHHHHHHVVLVARISLTLSHHFSLSSIASGRSSGLYPVSSHSCWMYVRTGRSAFALPYVGVHRSTSLMSSSLLLQQCPACLVRLTWIVFVIGGKWPYSWYLVGCCHQDLFNIARSILV